MAVISRDYTDGIISIDQIGTGFMLGSLPRVQEEDNWREWYEGDFRTLFPNPTINNGRRLYDAADQITFPIFSWGSSFYYQAAFSTPPTISFSNDAQKEWYAEAEPRFVKALERAGEDWSIKGRGIVVAYADGSVVAVDPTSYFRVGRLHDPDEAVGHILVFRYRSFEQESDRNNPQQKRFFDRVRVARYMPSEGINTVQEFKFDTFTIREPLGPQEEGDIAGIATSGQRDSWYGDVASIAARYMIRLTNNDVVLNQSDNRIRVLPQGLLGDQTPGEALTPKQRVDKLKNEVRPVLLYPSQMPAPNPDSAIGAETYYADRESFSKELVEAIWLSAGIPPSSFGIGVGRGESGAAREKTEHRAKARVQRFRRDLQIAIPAILRGMGCPDGDITATWLYPPFEDVSTQLPVVLQMLNAGLVDVPTAQAMLGLEIVDTQATRDEEQPESGIDNDAAG